MFPSAICATLFRLEFAKLGTSAFQDTRWNFGVPIIWEKPFKLMKNLASERLWRLGFLAGVPFNRLLSIPNYFLDVHHDLSFGACLAIAKFLALFCHDTIATTPGEKTCQPRVSFLLFFVLLSCLSLQGCHSDPLLLLLFSPFSKSANLSFSHQTLAMGDKRDAAMAGLCWPTSERTSTNPRTTGSTDSDMTDDIGHETFPPVIPSTLPGDTPHLPSHHHQPHPTTTTTTTPTTGLGHLALLQPGKCRPPFILGNALCTPSTSRSGTRIAPLALCTSRRSTNKESFVNLIRNMSFTSSPATICRLTRCQTIGALTTVSL